MDTFFYTVQCSPSHAPFAHYCYMQCTCTLYCNIALQNRNLTKIFAHLHSLRRWISWKKSGTVVKWGSWQPMRIHAEIVSKLATITSFCLWNSVKTIQYRLFWVKTVFLCCVSHWAHKLYTSQKSYKLDVFNILSAPRTFLFSKGLTVWGLW